MQYRDEDWLRREYDSRTIEDIADECEVSNATIIRWMERFGIERRSRGCQQREGEYKNEGWLRREYLAKTRSMSDISDDFGISNETIRYYLKKFDIPIRSASEATAAEWTEERRQELSEKYEGEGNPFWKGGVSPDAYRHPWPEIRKQALERDNYCQDCGAMDNLHVHHKTPVREFEDPSEAHTMDNVVVLCESCHWDRH